LRSLSLLRMLGSADVAALHKICGVLAACVIPSQQTECGLHSAAATAAAADAAVV
jgi:hypothetical protein